jgi:hypothetical protein
MSVPANSVGTRQLRSGAVTLPKIAPKAQLALRGARGPQGPIGPQGPQGAKGEPGAPGPATGSAGGDLTGSYPAPRIAPEAVTPSKIGVIPAARLVIGTYYNLGSGRQAIVGMSNVSFDNDHLWDTSPNGQTLRAPISGVYQIDAGIEWAANGSGDRFAAIQVDNTCCFAGDWVPAVSGHLTIQSVSDLLHLNAGQHVYLVGMQNSGGAVLINKSQATFVAMHWVSP